METYEIFRKAKDGKYAIGAFNAANLETLKAIVQAAHKLRAPVIIEASDGEVNFIGKREVVALIKIYREEYNLPIILNLDHAGDLQGCIEAIEAGFDYIHFDGSKLSYEKNVEITKRIVEVAHSKNIPVEGEIDHIQGSSADHRQENVTGVQKKELYSNPVSARKFVDETLVDTFASFIGNAHGLYANAKRIDIALLGRIKEALPDKFLSLHGGSGIPDEDIKSAISHGIVKINVNSELRVAFRDALKKVINSTEEVAIYKIMPEVIKAVQDVVEAKISLFGSANKA
ncbi:MAG: class II fructose-bisphosphate aldolase [Patescibacteria group bacterium]